MNNNQEAAAIVYEQYAMIAEFAGIPYEERWTEEDIYAQMNDFIHKYEQLYRFCDETLDCDWWPTRMNVCCHYYGEDEEYFIDLMAIIESIEEREDGSFDAKIGFTLDCNDESLPVWGDLANEGGYEGEEWDDEDDDDKPWLK